MTKVIWVICLSLLLANCKNNPEKNSEEPIHPEEETSILDIETTETVEIVENKEINK